MTDDDSQQRALEALYRRSRDEGPRQSTDDAILGAAAAAMRPGRSRWWKPLSAAAVIVLGVTVALQVFELAPVEQPLPLDDAAVPSRDRVIAERKAEPAESQPEPSPVEAEQVAPVKVKKAAVPETRAGRDAPASPKLADRPEVRAPVQVAPVPPEADERRESATSERLPQQMPDAAVGGMLADFAASRATGESNGEATGGAPGETPGEVMAPSISARDAAKEISLPSNLVRLRLLLPPTPTVDNLRQALPDAQVMPSDGDFIVRHDGAEAIRIEVSEPTGRLIRATLSAPSLRWLPGLPFGATRAELSPGCGQAECAVDPHFSYQYRQEVATGDWVMAAVRYEPR